MPDHNLSRAPRRQSQHPPFPRILCAVDGRPHTAGAIDQAITLAGDDARIVFAACGEDAPDWLATARSHAQGARIDFEVRVLPTQTLGEALLLQTATCDLLVVGAHPQRRGDGLVPDETATLLIRQSPVPVLIARPRPVAAGVLVATRGQPADRAALTAAAHIAARLGAELTVVHVAEAGDDAHEHELGSELTNARALLGHDLHFVTRRGPTAQRIVEQAEGSGAGLVVLGNPGRHPIETISSVSERVAHAAPCSALILCGH